MVRPTSDDFQEDIAQDEPTFTLNEREYFCRNCPKKVVSLGIPLGWYIIKASLGPREKLKTISIFCGVPCMLLDITKHVLGMKSY